MKFRYRIIYILSWLISFYSISVFSQQSIAESNSYSDFNKALTLFDNKAYSLAQKQFQKIQSVNLETSTIYSEATYYEAICAIKLGDSNADKKVIAFVENHPTSNKKNKAYLTVGNHYFSKRNPAYALQWYEKVDRNTLSKDDQKTIDFKMAYGLLIANKLDDAKKKFNSLKKDKKYGDDATYYFGYIAYRQGDFPQAEASFQNIQNKKPYQSNISYYLLDINFQSGNFQKCVDDGIDLIETLNKKEISEVSKIIGESYFNLGNYKESIPYLKSYRGPRGKWSNNDYYQVGYAYYKINDFKQAIGYFNKIIGLKNALAQNAYYHLAECYLKLNRKSEALNAFKAASELNFDLKIQEDAALNYAKLSYEEGNAFEEVSLVLQNFLKRYPNSASYNEINQLVVSAYLNQKDYEGALDYLNKRNSRQNSILKSEISLYRGIQLFNEEKFKDALPYFNNAKNSENQNIGYLAKFWEADALYTIGEYAKALTYFQNLFNTAHKNTPDELKLLSYNIGYCYFKLNNYKSAITYFNQFTQTNKVDQTVLNDAFVRLGDSYYALAQYQNAISYYNKAVKNKANQSDYAQFQIGMSYGLLGDNYRKIKELNTLINGYSSSNLKDDSLYQLASTYTKLKENQKAHETYKKLLSTQPNSVFIPRALVRQGLLYYNENKNNFALELFKRTASRFPNTPDAHEAVRNAKNIYIDEDKLSEYIAWTKSLNFVEVSDSEIEKSSFAIAQKKYFENKNQEAISSLEAYLTNFSDYPNSLSVTYYLADTYFTLNTVNKAEDYFKIIIDKGKNEYRERSLAKLSEIYLQNNQPSEAIPYLELLSDEAYESENMLFAQSNLMNVYFETESYEKAAGLAEKVLENNTIDSKLELDARKIISRTAMFRNDIDTAKRYYALVEEQASGELKVEAIYHRAYFEHIEKKYEESNQIIQELIANYSAYKYWGVKSYLIMAKNYYQLKDAYQATFILENVIKNFGQYEDLVKEANLELDLIKSNEATTNKSVNPQNKN